LWRGIEVLEHDDFLTHSLGQVRFALKADIDRHDRHVSLVSIADMRHSLNLGPAAYFEATIRTPPILRC
jgi:hypothetical protein